MKSGPTKVIIKKSGLFDATSGALIKDGLATRKEIEDYAAQDLPHARPCPACEGDGNR